MHRLPDGRDVAYRHRPGRGPAVVFLPGYMSDMAGTKATALLEWAAENGRECLLLDYPGCGESPGDFTDGTRGRWLDEFVSRVDSQVAGQVLLVGSSMGGWLMLLAAEELGKKVCGLVGVAAAPDFTDWGTTAEERERLGRGETVVQTGSSGPIPIHHGFWRDAQARRRLSGTIEFAGPVRLLQGMEDADVPWDVSLRLAAALRSPDVQLTLVKGGDHRLSREQDLALLLRTVASFE